NTPTLGTWASSRQSFTRWAMFLGSLDVKSRLASLLPAGRPRVPWRSAWSMLCHTSLGAPLPRPDFSFDQRPVREWWASAHARICPSVSGGERLLGAHAALRGQQAGQGGAAGQPAQAIAQRVVEVPPALPGVAGDGAGVGPGPVPGAPAVAVRPGEH